MSLLAGARTPPLGTLPDGTAVTAEYTGEAFARMQQVMQEDRAKFKFAKDSGSLSNISQTTVLSDCNFNKLN